MAGGELAAGVVGGGEWPFFPADAYADSSAIFAELGCWAAAGLDDGGELLLLLPPPELDPPEDRADVDTILRPQPPLTLSPEPAGSVVASVDGGSASSRSSSTADDGAAQEECAADGKPAPAEAAATAEAA
jgi:hypothetical protein